MYRKNILVFICCLVATILNGYIFNYINNTYFEYSSNDNGLEKFSETAKFFMIVIFAPLLETSILNLFPNWALRRLKVSNEFVLIIIPSILFALLHIYHPLYVVMTFIGGIILNWYYIYCQKNTRYTFWLVCLLHASYNLYGYIFVN